MKLQTLAPAALLLLAGSAIAQDAVIVTQPKPEAVIVTQPSSDGVIVTPNFATADINADGKLSIAELAEVMPDLTIIDVDSDGYVNQAEAQASISGLVFTTGEGTALITEPSYNVIVAKVEDEDELDLDLDDDDADVDIRVEGDVDVNEDN